MKSLYAGMLGLKGFSLNVFSDDELDAIHQATLEILQQTGIKVESEEALDIFDAGGANVDRKTKIVKIPAYLVEDCIRSAPSHVLLAGRNPKRDVMAGGKKVHFTNFGEGINIVDPYTGEFRKTTKQDAADVARVIDACDSIDLYERAVDASDVTPGLDVVHEAEAYLSNTTKHCFVGPGTRELGQKVIEMAAAIQGGEDKLRQRPLITFNVCPSSPLKIGKNVCEPIIDAAKAGIPINILSMTLAGGTGPVTMAGTLVVHNAELLSGLVLNQLTCKGAPVIYGSSTTILDLKTATAATGAPELGMINAAVAKMAQYYLLPSFVAGG